MVTIEGLVLEIFHFYPLFLKHPRTYLYEQSPFLKPHLIGIFDIIIGSANCLGIAFSISDCLRKRSEMFSSSLGSSFFSWTISKETTCKTFSCDEGQTISGYLLVMAAKASSQSLERVSVSRLHTEKDVLDAIFHCLALN